LIKFSSHFGVRIESLGANLSPLLEAMWFVNSKEKETITEATAGWLGKVCGNRM
jgi:hypothetical protein